MLLLGCPFQRGLWASWLKPLLQTSSVLEPSRGPHSGEPQDTSSVAGRAPGISVVSCPRAHLRARKWVCLLGWLAGCLLSNCLCSEKRGGQCSRAVRVPGMCMTWGFVLRISSASLCPCAQLGWTCGWGGRAEPGPGACPAFYLSASPRCLHGESSKCPLAVTGLQPGGPLIFPCPCVLVALYP